MRKFLLLSIIYLPLFSLAQKVDSEDVYAIADVPAEYVDGYGAFYAMINEKLVYPPQAEEQNIEGKVYVQFVIDKTGDLVDESVKAVKSDSDLLNEEAVRVVRLSPNWVPARSKKKGPTVKQRKFCLLPLC